MNLRRRMDALQAAQAKRVWPQLAAAGAPYGFTAEDLLDDARRWFCLSLAQPLQAVDDVEPELRAAGSTSDDIAHVHAVLTR